MSYAPDYIPGFDFEDYQALNPAKPLPGTQVDSELASVQNSVNSINANLQKIQRDDDRLANGSVHAQTFDASALILIESGWNYRGAWTPGTPYVVGDYVVVVANNASYIAVVDHTSGADFATDYAAGYWGLVFQAGAGGDVYGPPGASADEITTYADGTGKLIGNSGVQIGQVARRNQDNYFEGSSFVGFPGAEVAVMRSWPNGVGGVFGRVRPGQSFDDNDGGIVVTDGEVRLLGAAAYFGMLDGATDARQVYVTADGYIYGVDPPEPGWSVSDTDTGVYDTGTGTTTGPWVLMSGLQVTVPQDVTDDKQLLVQATTVADNVTTNREGVIEVAFGVNGAQPTTTGIQHIIVPDFNGILVSGMTIVGTPFTNGDTIEIWVRRVSGSHGAFGVTFDGSGAEPHALTVLERGGAGSGGGGDVVGPASSTPGAVATYSGTTGKLLQDSSKITAQLPQLDQANVFDGPSNEFSNPVTQGGERLIATLSNSPPPDVTPVYQEIFCTQEYYDSITPDPNTIYHIPGVPTANIIEYLGTFTAAANVIDVVGLLTGYKSYMMQLDGIIADSNAGLHLQFLTGVTPFATQYTFVGTRNVQTVSPGTYGSNGTAHFDIAGTLGLLGGQPYTGRVWMNDIQNRRGIQWMANFVDNATSNSVAVYGAGSNTNSGQNFDGIRIKPSSGALAGTVRVWGYK